MNNAIRYRLTAAAVVVLAGCSGSSVSDGVIGGPGGSSATIQAVLAPVIAVDASGHVERQDPAGTASDRLTAEIEIFSGGFGAVGIDASDGFADESVRLRVARAGAEVFSTAMAFSEDRRVGGTGDITFEIDVRGTSVPALESGDAVEVQVNGVDLLEGSFTVL